MRLMKRNQTAIYYCLYKGKEPLLDEDGKRYENSTKGKQVCSGSR